MSLRLDNKSAILSKAFKGHNVRPETEGGDNDGDAGEPVPAREYTLSDITLTKKQFELLVGEHAVTSFFNESATKPIEPAFSSFKTLWLDDTYKNCGVKYSLGNTNTKEIDIDGGAKIKNLSVKLTGGNDRACAKLRCTVQSIFPMKLTTLEMENFLGKEIRVSLRFGAVDEADDEANKQTDLIDAAQEGEEAEASSSRKTNGDEARAAH